MKLIVTNIMIMGVALAAALPALALSPLPGRSIMVVGHRGASGYAPENTMAAFRIAHEQTADMVELDVYMSADGHVVIMHDKEVDRTTDGEGNIESMTLEQIRLLDAGSWMKPEFAGERVPTLDEVLEWARPRILVNIEIKGAGCEEKIVELVKKHGMIDKVIVSSFHHEYLAKIKDLEPAIKTGALFGDPMDIEKIVESCHPDAINPKYTLVTADMVKQAHALGLQVNVYTVNDPLSMKQMIKYKVDSIITNFPDMLVKQTDKNMPKTKPPAPSNAG
jgi:glycerophosphoryl diester phosphodiesterase